MNETLLSERAISNLTGFARETVKRRLRGIKPASENGNGALYKAPEAIQAVFNIHPDEHEQRHRKLEAEAVKAELETIEQFQFKVPASYAATALSFLAAILDLEQLPEETASRIFDAIHTKISSLEKTAKQERAAAYAAWRKEMFGPIPAPKSRTDSDWPEHNQK